MLLFKQLDSPSALLACLKYHTYTIWLFPYQQIFDVVIPLTIFAVSTSLAGKHFDLPPQSASTIGLRAPMVVIWLWTMMLLFCIRNQRHAHSIAEDAINKPWRPLPSKRLTPSHATTLLFWIFGATALLSYKVGALPYFSVFELFSILYNDFNAGDYNALTKNGLNAAGYACLFSGALKVVIGPNAAISPIAWQWIAIQTFLILTAIHAQDFRDQEGDRSRGRRTIISEMGERNARWALIVAVLFWSVYVPQWMRVALEWRLVSVALGAAVVGLNLRGMFNTSPEIDGKMYRVWSVWFMSFCPLPLCLLFPGISS